MIYKSYRSTTTATSQSWTAPATGLCVIEVCGEWHSSSSNSAAITVNRTGTWTSNEGTIIGRGIWDTAGDAMEQNMYTAGRVNQGATFGVNITNDGTNISTSNIFYICTIYTDDEDVKIHLAYGNDDTLTTTIPAYTEDRVGILQIKSTFVINNMSQNSFSSAFALIAPTMNQEYLYFFRNNNTQEGSGVVTKSILETEKGRTTPASIQSYMINGSGDVHPRANGIIYVSFPKNNIL